MWGVRCEVEASPAPHPDSSRESLRPGLQETCGPQGFDTASGTPRSRGGRPLPWLVAPPRTLPTMPDTRPKACSQ